MEGSASSPGDASATPGGRCKSPRSSSCSSSSSSSSIATEGPRVDQGPPLVKDEETVSVPPVPLPVVPTFAGEAEGVAAAAAEMERSEAPGGGESLRALQLLLSDVLGVLAMLRPAGSSALPRGVAAAVSRARQAAQAALKQQGRKTGDNSSAASTNNATIAAALAAAANTAAVVLEQRNPQFAFHQFTVLAAASLQQLAPYVTHHLRDLLQVLEQRRSLLRLLRSQERRERQGTAASPAEGQTDNLRLLLQVFLAYCPAAMLDAVCDRLAAAYTQALLGETLPAQQQKKIEAAGAAAPDGMAAEGAPSSVEGPQTTQEEAAAAAAAAATAVAAAAPAPATTTAAADDDDGPRSLARPQNDEVGVSVAALLGQRCFLQRLASSINWGHVGSVAKGDDAAANAAAPNSRDNGSIGGRGAQQAAENPEVAGALRRAYGSAACLFDTEGPWPIVDEGPCGEVSAGGASPDVPAAATGSNLQKKEQPLLLSVPLHGPTIAEVAYRAASSSPARAHDSAVLRRIGRQAQEVVGTERGLDASEEAFISPSEPAPEPAEGGSGSSSSSSSQLLRALGSLELPPSLLQSSSSYSRSASPAAGLRCSSSEETAAETSHGAAASDTADYLRDGASDGGFVEGVGGAAAAAAATAAAAAAANTAFCRPSWPLQQKDGSSSSSKRRTLLEALSEVPEDCRVIPSRRKGGGRVSPHAKRDISSAPAGVGTTAPAFAVSSADLRYLESGEPTGEGGGGGDGEEDAATRKATLVSFLLSLLPDSGTYAAAAAPPDAAAAGAALHETVSAEEGAAGATNSLGSTQALLNSLQGHLLRYGPEDKASEHPQQQHEALALTAAGGRRSRNGGPPPVGRVGLYGKIEGAAGQHSSAVGRDAGAAAAALKRELLPHDDAAGAAAAAAAGGISGRLSEPDPSRGRGRMQQQHAVALRPPGAAGADAGELGGDGELVGAGSGGGSYSSLAESLGAPEEDILGGGAPGGVNTQLLYRSTISGVVYDKSGQKWTARWSEYGRQHKKTFATAKYGFLHAKKRAEACRLEASRLMREGQGRALAAAARLAQVGGGLQADGGGPGAPPPAFSGITMSADASHTLQGKDTPPESDHQPQHQLMLQQDTQQKILQQEPQHQLLQPHEKDIVKTAAIETAPQVLLEAQLPGPAAAPPPKRRRHKLFSGDP